MCIQMWRIVAPALVVALLGGACGGQGMSTGVDAADASVEMMMADQDGVAPPDQSGGPQGLTVSLHTVSPLPFDDGQATITTAALWFSRISFISDQGQSADAELRSLPLDVGAGVEGHDPEWTLPAAPPGLYSLARVTIGAADGTPLPNGFAGQRLSMRMSGTIHPARAFTISDAESGTVDVRAATPMELKAGALLHVIVDVDVSHWLAGQSFDHGDSSEPLVIGPDGDGGFRDDTRARVLGSLGIRLAP
jgi:hypothetical protein